MSQKHHYMSVLSGHQISKYVFDLIHKQNKTKDHRPALTEHTVSANVLHINIMCWRMLMSTNQVIRYLSLLYQLYTSLHWFHTHMIVSKGKIQFRFVELHVLHWIFGYYEVEISYKVGNSCLYPSTGNNFHGTARKYNWRQKRETGDILWPVPGGVREGCWGGNTDHCKTSKNINRWLYWWGDDKQANVVNGQMIERSRIDPVYRIFVFMSEFTGRWVWSL